MASSKRSKASRSNSSRAVAPPAASARPETNEAQRASLASAILRPPPVLTDPEKALHLLPLVKAAPAVVSAPAAVSAPAVVSAPAAVSAPAPAAQTAPATVRGAVSGPAPAVHPVPAPVSSTEELRKLVAQLAYLRAENLGFGRTNPLEDWLWAEQEVTRRLQARAA